MYIRKLISHCLREIIKPEKQGSSVMATPMKHREACGKFLFGHGLEIGALHFPTKIPPHCSIEYLDVESIEKIRTAFPDIDGHNIVEPNYVGDICKHTISDITKKRFNFIILNHVLEHVANPIQVIQNIWEGIADSGFFIISVPDKDFTFDRTRPLATYEHLLADYFLGIIEVCNDHYIDFLNHVHPEVFSSKERFLNALQSVRNRREHVHIWNSQTFRSSLIRIFEFLNINAIFTYESMGSENQIEYFAIIQKGHNKTNHDDALKVLLSMYESHPDLKKTHDAALKVLFAVYESRPDLKKVFPATQRYHLHNLLNWTVTAGATIDSAKEILAPYQRYYKEILNSMKIDSLKWHNGKWFIAP